MLNCSMLLSRSRRRNAEDPGTLNLDNALILVYVVALITSPDDEEALEEHRRLIVRMLTDYKKALGLE